MQLCAAVASPSPVVHFISFYLVFCLSTTIIIKPDIIHHTQIGLYALNKSFLGANIFCAMFREAFRVINTFHENPGEHGFGTEKWNESITLR